MQHPIAKAGVMGWPISHSLSPWLHGFWLKSYGIAGDYEAFEVKPDALRDALRTLHVRGLRGVNLTVPHKENACTLVDTLDDTARRIGAVNLVTADEKGHLHGSNTDAYGFTQNLLGAGFKPDQGKVALLGAGGAARAIIVALSDMGFSEISIVNRNPDRARKIAHEFSSSACKIAAFGWADTDQALAGASLLVNATSLGMKGQPPLDVSLDSLAETATVTDLVYAPLETGLLQMAKKRGHKTIDGLGMLLHQARPAFAAFFGKDPEVTQELRDFVLAGRE